MLETPTMFSISYLQIVLFISVLWLLSRTCVWLKRKSISLKRELQLLLVYICLVVVARFTFCPFFLVDGKIPPLVFDQNRVIPIWVNFVPFVYLFDYPNLYVTLLNIIGNVAMFIPLGIVWPAVYKELNTPVKAIAAGAGVSFVIEILQLPFFDRATDVDDLLLNTLGFLVGYGIYLLVKKLRKGRK